MKKYLIIIMISFLCILTGCFIQEEIPVVEEVEEVEETFDLTEVDDSLTVEKLISTRNEIMEYNIYLEASFYYTQNLHGTTTNILAATSLGSGVIVAEDEAYYYIITNYHVVEYEDYDDVSYSITTYDDYTYNIYYDDVVYINVDNDLALLRINNMYLLEVIDIDARYGDELEKGELLFAVGNPSGVENNVTFGEYIRTTSIPYVDYDVIYHSAQISSGNSGGALCDVDGNLVGINTWGTEDDSTQSYSIPLWVVHEFLNEYFI